MRRNRPAPALVIAAMIAAVIAAVSAGCGAGWRRSDGGARPPAVAGRPSVVASPSVAASPSVESPAENASAGNASASPSAATGPSGSPATSPSGSPNGSGSPSASVGAGTSGSPSGGGTVVAAARVSRYGTILLDGRGRTLYVFDADRSTRSTCASDCAGTWLAVTTTSAPVAGQGADDGLLGATPRGDGSAQVLYNGRPLYYYTGDSSPGDTNGEGVHQYGGGWWLADAAGHPISGS